MGEQALFGMLALHQAVPGLVAPVPEAVPARVAASGPAVGLLEALRAGRWYPRDPAVVVRPREFLALASEAPRRGGGRPPQHC